MTDDYIELKDLPQHAKKEAVKKKVSGFKKKATDAFGRAKVRYNKLKTKAKEINEKMSKPQAKGGKQTKSFGMRFLENANKQDLGLSKMSMGGFGQPMARTKKGKKGKQRPYNFGQFGV